MILIKINRKYLGIIITCTIMGLIGLWTLEYQNPEDVSCVNGTSMGAFLAMTNSQELRQEEVEIFNIKKGEVIKTTQINTIIQDEADKYLKSIIGIVAKVNAIPDKGVIIKIPLKNSVKLQNKWFSGVIDKIFILFPNQDKPYLVLIDNKNRPIFLNFSERTDLLLKNLGDCAIIIDVFEVVGG